MKPIIITSEDIADCTDEATFMNGVRSYKEKNVQGLRARQIDEFEVQLRSSVQGDNRHVYMQRIDIFEADAGRFLIEGMCNCIDEYNCDHVVAACIQYMQGSAPSGEQQSLSPCLIWVDAFAKTLEPPPELQSTDFIVYVLSGYPTLAGLGVELKKTRPLKKGGLSKGTRSQIYSIAISQMQHSHITLVDIEIARLLMALESRSWHDCAITGELGVLVLNKMIQTGRCYWQNLDDGPLAMGEQRRVDLAWHGSGGGDMRLAINIDPAAQFLNLTPPMYLDPQENEVGTLNGLEFSPAQWTALIRAPVVPADSVEKFSLKLVSKVPQLPPPSKLELVELSAAAAIPLLRLSSNQSGGDRAHSMRLRFAYDGHEISIGQDAPVVHINTEKQVLRIHRDLQAESAALTKLAEVGFRRALPKDSQDINLTADWIVNPMEATAHWQRFLDEVRADLESQGWIIEQADEFGLHFIEPDEWEFDVEEGSDWFNLRFDMDVGGRKIALLPLIANVLGTYKPDQLPEKLNFSLGDGRYVSIPVEMIRPIIDTLFELYDSSNVSDEGSLRLSRLEAARLADLESAASSEVLWRGGGAMRELGRKLKDFKGVESVPVPVGLNADLREYQKQGLSWLQFLREYSFSGVLADDMGLGKTVQTLANLLIEKEQGRMDKPCLIVAPTSLMSNWRREAEQFTPALKVLVSHGTDRHSRFDQIEKVDLVVTTYPLLARDADYLLKHQYYYLVLDEAQIVKNPLAKASRIVRKINAKHRLCLTGTPMENHLGELWALFDFLMPGLLGDRTSFTREYRTPIEKYGDGEKRQRLVKRIAPFMLRRKKTEVMQELPPKTEIIRSISFDKKQAALYESIRLSMEKRVRDAIAENGLARSHITVLDALLKLRQVCCDPSLLSLSQAKNVNESAKLELLMDLVPEMIEEGRRILIFSQFAKMLGIIEKRIIETGIEYTKLTGSTRNRDQVIDRFRSGEAKIFLISLKAGGVGLNLVEADTVIHYDPWWNPAVENQASDRAHRIGQDKPVFVYKLVADNTVEEKILSMQEKKRALAEGVYQNDGKADALKLSADDLSELFAPL